MELLTVAYLKGYVHRDNLSGNHTSGSPGYWEIVLNGAKENPDQTTGVADEEGDEEIPGLAVFSVDETQNVLLEGKRAEDPRNEKHETAE